MDEDDTSPVSPTSTRVSVSFPIHAWKEIMDQEDELNERTTSKSSTTAMYVGSYAILVGFLREVRETGCEPLSDKRFRTLMRAVEDVCNQGMGQTVSLDQELFKDAASKEHFSEVLPALGISISMGNSARRSLSSPRDSCGRSSIGIGTESVHSLQESVASLLEDEQDIAFLSELAFDRRCRGDIVADASVLVHAFRTPNDLMKRYSIQADEMGAWCVSIAEQYLENHYHNWRHAFDVFQFSYVAINAGQSGKFFNFQDILAVQLACIAHDVGHLGTNNAFLVKTEHALAMVYNDQSPLENMHASVCFKTMRRPGFNFLRHMPSRDYNVLRPKMVDCILSTDMSKHFELVDRFSARVSKSDDNPFVTDTKYEREKQKSSKGDRRMLMQVFVHVADIGHTLRPWNIHKHLVVALEEEFFGQGDQEKELGIPVMPMMDRSCDSLACSQSFFLDKLVRPLVDPFTIFIKAPLCTVLLDNLSNNKQTWENLVEKYGKLTAGEIVPLEDDEEAAASSM